MLTRYVKRGLCWLVFLACVAPAHSAEKFPDYPVQQPSDYHISARQEEVSIGLQPVESVQDQQTYFHTSLSPSGFLPVMVVVHNQSKSDSLLLDTEGISYGTGDPGKTAPKDNSVGQKVAISSAYVIPYIGPFIAMGLAKDASEVKQNMVHRQLRSGTLSPGDTVHGFLYIPIPKKGPRPMIHVQFTVAWAGSDRTSVLHFDF